MKELPHSERPYEKLEMYGEKALSNSELLGIIIKTGTKEDTAVDLAQKVLTMCTKNGEEGRLNLLEQPSIAELCTIKGIGKVKAIQIKAICELAKRMSKPIKRLDITIQTPKDVLSLVQEEMQYETKEMVKVILLNSRNKVQKIVEIATGGTNFALAIPKDILREAVKLGIPKMILVHNHPSGDSKPSNQDIKLTQKLKKACQLLEIQLLDHIIIGHNEYTSIFQNYSQQLQNELFFSLE